MWELVIVSLLSSYGNNDFRVEPFMNKDDCILSVQNINVVGKASTDNNGPHIIAYCRPKIEKEVK